MSASAKETPFSVPALVRQVIKERGGANTPDARRAVAVEVASRIPARHRADAFVYALTTVVYDVVVTSRPHLRLTPPPGAEPGNAQGGQKVHSSKVSSMRRIGTLLRATYAAVPDKEVGDYTAEDINLVATHLECVAQDASEKAFRFREIAGHMTALGVKRIRDLPEDILRETFYRQGGAAA